MIFMRPLFIALYGINNIGKTTHAHLLVRRLQALGRAALYVKYPIYDLKPTGPLLSKILRSSKTQNLPEEELQLLFALNRFQFEPKLQALLKKGTIVVAEDYIGTGLAWGLAKGARLDELVKMNKFLVRPSLEILLEGRRKLGSVEHGHLHETNELLARRCEKKFKELAVRFRWKRLQVAEDRDLTAARIWTAVRGLVYSKRP